MTTTTTLLKLYILYTLLQLYCSPYHPSRNITCEVEVIDAEGKIRQVGLHPSNGRGALYNFQGKNKWLCTLRNGGSSTCVCREGTCRHLQIWSLRDGKPLECFEQRHEMIWSMCLHDSMVPRWEETAGPRQQAEQEAVAIIQSSTGGNSASQRTLEQFLVVTTVEEGVATACGG